MSALGRVGHHSAWCRCLCRVWLVASLQHVAEGCEGIRPQRPFPVPSRFQLFAFDPNTRSCELLFSPSGGGLDEASLSAEERLRRERLRERGLVRPASHMLT